jgi:Xaa-Pro dipeptidase
LIAAGLVVGDLDEAMAANIGAVFMPHGLGHFLGIDTHDVGGYPGSSKRPELAGYARLRTTRTLEENMYITVEPGCYFIDVLLDEALADPARGKFLNAAAIQPYRGTGGVRIEDDVLVTATGCENFTLAPRTPEDVEAACAGKITSITQVKKHK